MRSGIIPGQEDICVVPLVDLRYQHCQIRNKIDAAIAKVLDSNQFVLGNELEAFENEFAAYCEVRDCIGVGSGTDALFLALKACDISRGDEVITVSHTFVATAEAISRTGATPVFVDIDSSTYTIDPERVEEAITPTSKAIIPVHLYGQCADMDPLLSLAEEHGLWIIEDACQAHGATYKDRKAGSMGHAGCFSFYPSKNLGAFGDGGAVVTNDSVVAERVRSLRNHGQVSKYYQYTIGCNSRLGEIQAAILQVKLRCLDEWNRERRRIAACYDELLSEYVVIPDVRINNEHVYHLYVIRSEHRDKLYEYLQTQGVTASIHYPIPIHKQTSYLGSTGSRLNTSLDITEKVAGTVLSLPLYPGLREQHIRTICQAIENFFKDKRKPSDNNLAALTMSEKLSGEYG